MNKLKNTLIVILTAGLLITSYFAWYYHGQKNNAETKTVKNQKTVELAANIISRMVDSSGRNHTTISASGNVLPNDWYKDGTAIKGGFIDTVARALNIKNKKQLEEVTQISIKNEARALKAEKKVDSLQRITFFYKGKYMQLAYRPPMRPTDTTDQGQFDYKYNDSITVVQYWKRKWILGAKKSYIDIFSNDPNATVNGVKRMVVEQKEPTFGLRVQAVGNYSFSRKLLNIGPGLQFDFKRFSLVGTYYYDFDANQFRPSVGARYDLIRF
jgi:hypothetical protein